MFLRLNTRDLCYHIGVSKAEYESRGMRVFVLLIVFTTFGLAKTTTRNPIFPENRRFRQKSKGGSPGKLEKSPFLTPKMSISRGDYEKNSNFQKMSISRGESGKMTFFDQKLNEDSATPKTTPKPRAPYRVYHFRRRENRAPKTTNTTTLNLFLDTRDGSRTPKTTPETARSLSR